MHHHSTRRSGPAAPGHLSAKALCMRGVFVLAALVAVLGAASASTLSCTSSCDFDTQYETAACVPAVPEAIIDLNTTDTTQMVDITTDGDIELIELDSISFSGFYGSIYYILNRSKGSATVNFTFPLHGSRTQYNVSASYAYVGSTAYPDALPYIVSSDADGDQTFFQNQQVEPSDSQNFTFLGQVHATNVLHVAINISQVTGRTAFASVDAVQIIPADAALLTAIPSECAALTSCTAAQFISANATMTSNRNCTDLTTCSASQFESTPPTSFSDRICSNLTTCTSAQYEATSATATSDRTCATITTCNATQYISDEATDVSDRVCAECSVCDDATEIIVSNCTASNNTVCRDITVDYTYGPFGNFSVGCDNQTRTREEFCADVKCKNPQATSETINVNGGCEDICEIENGAITCSCTQPAYTIDVVNCTTVMCSIPSYDNASLSSTADLRIGESVTVTCDDGATSSLGDSFVATCLESGDVTNATETCVDINECETNNGGCPGLCVNTDGSFYCVAVDPCETNNGGCDQNCVFTGVSGERNCTCDSGYELDIDETSCLDINECDVNNGGCEQICTNSAGSFNCSCMTGFLVSNTNSSACNPMSCDDPPASFSTNAITTATLQSQGPFEFGDMLIYDCEEGFSVDGDASSATSFALTCIANGQLNGTDMGCENIDECASLNGGCDQDCTDSVGSFSCSCAIGYELSAQDNATCNNIDECTTADPCAQTCTDTDGSFTCSCDAGYTLNVMDSVSCDRNACAMAEDTFRNATLDPTSDGILVFEEQVNYTCFEGYSVAGMPEGAAYFTMECTSAGTLATTVMGAACLDIDECADTPCDQTCANSLGSFTCSCDAGYTLNAVDGVSCDRNECREAASELRNATLDPTSDGILVFEEQVNYTCATGFTTSGLAGGDTYFTVECQSTGTLALTETDVGCYDVNECDAHPCTQMCTNTVGSFECSCRSGFQLVASRFCIDVNECLQDPNPCASDADTQCVNLAGSFSCNCVAGFDRVDGVCRRTTYNLLSIPLISTAHTLPAQTLRTSTDGVYRVYFGGDRALRVVDKVVASSAAFSIAAELTVSPGSGGYLFYGGSVGGGRRDFGLYLYSASDQIGIFHKDVAGGAAVAKFSLAASISDGLRHTLLLSVVNTTASLIVDGAAPAATVTLSAPITWCNNTATDCVYYVGQRSSSQGGAFRFSGILSQFSLNAFSSSATITALTSPSPLLSGPSFVDALTASNRVVVGTVPVSTNSLYTGAVAFDGRRADTSFRFDGDSALLVPQFHEFAIGDAAAFTVAMTASVDISSFGYLFSKTTSSGSRYFSLYSSSGGSLTMYYRRVGSSATAVASFAANIADGVPHRVLLSVYNTTASLYVDGVLRGRQALGGLVDDCGAPSAECLLQIGRRPSATSVSGAFFLSGSVENAVFFSGVAMTSDPSPLPQVPQLTQTLPTDENGYMYLDLLNATNAADIGSIGRSADTDDVVFNGTGRLVVLEHSFSLGSSFSVAGTVQIEADARGYIFAKTDAIGSTRYVALYVSGSVLVMYYTSTATTRTINSHVFTGVDLNDGVTHNLLLTLEYNATTAATVVSLFVDGREASVGSVAGRIVDCGGRSISCALTVGQRQTTTSTAPLFGNGAFGISGVMSILRLYPSRVLTVADSPSMSLAGPPYFSVAQSMYIPGQNQGGAFRSGVSVEECARLCLDETRCLSFDAGVVGGSLEGSCFLSYVKANGVTIVLAQSYLFSYYEKL